ncbi:MAG TPA: DUF4870 domain-containing protein [Candidatus Saccharimonadales bacterium]|nr:DUF4870 domain-containing protein [Candidatus Saccharimonadales bacterium]
MSKEDTNRNIVAALSYFLGFITGIIILLVEKDDKYVRFHAMQSTIIFGGFFVLNIIFNVVFGGLSFLGILAKGISTLLTVISLVIWIVSMIKAYQGDVFKWPIAGNFAEKHVGKQ